jgi:site-specific recombinase XerD
MPQATFVLKEPTSKEKTLIYLLFRFNGSKLKYSTGQKIYPKLWNPEKQRAKELRTSKEHESINMLLDDLEAGVNNAHRKMLLEGITPTPELLRTKLHQILKKESSPSKDLANFAETVLEASNKKAGTKRAIRQTIRNLNEFKDKFGISLHFDSINLEFYDKYLAYAKSQGYSQNTIGSHIKNIKSFMREAFERGLTHNVQFQSKRFKILEEESQSIYLSDKELVVLEKLDLRNNPRLDKVRDLFLVGCYTGLRFSDLRQLTIENISKDKKVVKIRTQKTDETVIIPINSVVNRIFHKYGGNPPSAMSNEKMNEYLKELSEKAGFDHPIEIIFTKGGERIKEINKKHELVTVHTARRSFATNAYLHNVPTISIMKITGHKTEKSFLKYIKISQEDNANKLIHHPFFS